MSHREQEREAEETRLLIDALRYWGPVLLAVAGFGFIVWGVWFYPLKEAFKDKRADTHYRIKTLVLFGVVFLVLFGLFMSAMGWIAALLLAAVLAPFIAGALGEAYSKWRRS